MFYSNVLSLSINNLLDVILQEKSHTDTLHFWDGERKIDMILAYEDDDNGEEDDKKAEKRKTFQRNLEEQGLELELEPSNVSNFLKIFIKINS